MLSSLFVFSMYNNLKSRTKSIDGQEYELPPLVVWDQAHRRFRVQLWNNNIQQKVVCFSVKAYGSVALALEAAKDKAKEEREKGLTKPPYRVLGVDAQGKPVSLGRGIYMQINTDRNNYQLLRVLHGTRGKGNFRRQSIPLGYAGYFTVKHFNAQLKKAQELQQRWVREDAANEQQFQPQPVKRGEVL